MRIVVLGGAGQMGRHTVRDLVESPDVAQVILADFDSARAEEVATQIGSPKVSLVQADVTDVAATEKVVRGADVCINSVNYYFNVAVMRACLAARVHYIDLGGLFHTTREQWALDPDFRAAGLSAVLGLGSSPGISNLQAGFLAAQLERVDSIRMYNGATTETDDPLASAYTMQTILDELTRNPVIYRYGDFVELEPLAEEEQFLFPEPVGLRKTHHTIHSEMATLPLVFADKGVREVFFKISYFGYSEDALKFLARLARLGLASTDPLAVKGGRVAPRDVLLAAVAERTKQAPDRGTATGWKAVSTIVRGRQDGSAVELRLDTLVPPHAGRNLSGGTLLVSVPPSIGARWLAAGRISRRGVFPPEVGIDAPGFFKALEAHGVRTTLTRTENFQAARPEF